MYLIQTCFYGSAAFMTTMQDNEIIVWMEHKGSIMCCCGCVISLWLVNTANSQRQHWNSQLWALVFFFFSRETHWPLWLSQSFLPSLLPHRPADLLFSVGMSHGEAEWQAALRTLGPWMPCLAHRVSCSSQERSITTHSPLHQHRCRLLALQKHRLRWRIQTLCLTRSVSLIINVSSFPLLDNNGKFITECVSVKTETFGYFFFLTQSQCVKVNVSLVQVQYE